ncbi:MAG: hypothetical protein E7374_03425 [Clostridiales bacterium]|nr:hypothetical protein [Clostridiales bacterium]
MMKRENISSVLIFLQAILLTTIVVFFALAVGSFNLPFNAFKVFKSLAQVLVFSCIPYVAFAFNIKTTKTLQVYILIAFLGHLLGGNVFRLYATCWYYSFVLHMVNSAVIGIIIYNQIHKKCPNHSKQFLFLMTMCAVLAVGVLWELFEYFNDIVFASKNMQRTINSITHEPFVGKRAIRDTMIDFLMDMAGGVLSCGLALIPIKGKPMHKYFQVDFPEKISNCLKFKRAKKNESKTVEVETNKIYDKDENNEV